MRRREVCQNSWKRRTNEKLCTQTSRWNLGMHVKIYHGITAFRHLIDPGNGTAKNGTQNKGRYVSSIATVRTRWKVVVWFYGVLLLSATCARPPGRKENSVWMTISIQRVNNAIWSNGWISSDVSSRFIKTSSMWQESITRNLSGLWADRGRNLEWRDSDCGSGRFEKVGRIRYLSSKNQRERSIDSKKEMNSFSQ